MPSFHPSFEASLASLVADLPQAVLLTGPKGIGLMTAATHLASKIGYTVQVVHPEKKEVIDEVSGTITVDIIRRLYDQTRSKTSGRIIIIDQADTMGVVAQNAFLKLLEEPQKNSHFILLAHRPNALLPTVRSRVQHYDVLLISAEQSQQLLDSFDVKDGMRRSQLLFMAQGLPAELTRLQDETYFAYRSDSVRDARTYVTGTSYERLKIAQKYKDDVATALQLLDDALHQLRMTLVAKKDPSVLESVSRLMAIYDRISAQGNVRLQLANL